MSVQVSHVQKAVEAAFTKRFPIHMEHCDADVRFGGCSRHHIMFDARVSVRSSDDYRALREKLNRTDYATHILSDFEYYGGADDDEQDYFTINGLQFTLGDGDDAGAVTELGPWEIDVWVRVLGLTQEVHYGD